MSAALRFATHRTPPVRGFAILSAIFLIVVLALLGAMIVVLSSMQQVSQVRDMDGSRAYFAARTGVEWGVYRVLHDTNCAANSTLPTLAGSASGFLVTVTCMASGPTDEGGNNVMVYLITSTAARGTPSGFDYVERQVEAVISTP